LTNIVQVPLLIHEREAIVTRAAGILKRGGQVVFPTEHCYAIAVDAFNVEAVGEVNLLRRAATGTALSVMIGSPRTLSGIAREIPPMGDLLIAALWPGLLTLVFPTSFGLGWDLGDGGVLGKVAVRMPLHPLALAILRETGPLAVTTAAPQGAEAPLEVEALAQSIADSVELILDAGALPAGPPSTIIDLSTGQPTLIREGAYTRERLGQIAPDLVLD
jgi:L-threonylcarbamoyladenylate synthase